MASGESEEPERASASGPMAPLDAAAFAIAAAARARDAGARTLLVDFSRVVPAAPLSTIDAYEVGVRLAQQGVGLCRVAFLMSAGCLGANRFVLEVAANRGLAAAAFLDDREALRWLRSPRVVSPS
jgi:hypothetical protein